jgi:HlyD family secretion protein
VIFIIGCSEKQPKSFQGYVEGEFVYVATSIAGRLDSLMVHRGEEVKNDAPLFALESEDELEAQRQAIYQVKASSSQLGDLLTGKRPAELDVVRAQLEQAIANAKKSELQLKRDEEQYAAKGISKGQLDDSRYQHESDLGKIAEMQSQLVSSKLPARDDQIRAQKAQVAVAKAALAQAQWRLDQKSVFATRKGLVFDTLYRVGEWVPAGNPVVQMLPPENIKVRFFVPEKSIGRLKINQGIKIHIDGVSPDVEAHVTYISTQAEYTPPVIYSNETRSKLVFMIEAHPELEKAPLLHPGQPVVVTAL